MSKVSNHTIRDWMRSAGFLPKMMTTTHRCPAAGSDITGCCGVSTFKLPEDDRLTVHEEFVTCKGKGEQNASDQKGQENHGQNEKALWQENGQDSVLQISQCRENQRGTQEKEVSPSITCPRCGMVSFNPNDIDTRYCGQCHQFHEEMI